MKTTAPVTEKKPSIAVLPFINMSADPAQDFFCDGMTEEIINALSHVEDLKVIARTSAFAFKGKNEDIREIGRKLEKLSKECRQVNLEPLGALIKKFGIEDNLATVLRR